MSRRGHLSVQDIKGRFETLPDFPVKNNVSVGEHRRYQKRFDVSLPSERCYDVLKDEYEEELDEDNGSLRLRSLSVGTAFPRGVYNDHEKGDTSKKKVIRNHSFNKVKQTQNGKLCYEDSSTNFKNYNLSSFAEKQKLVENIVMNIRNTAKKAEEDRKTKDFKARDIFSITSKLEKDLKNVIEKGSRLKWHSKQSMNKSLFEDKGDELSPKCDSSFFGSRYEPIQNSNSEKNNETRVRLLSPFRTYSNDALLDTPDKSHFIGFRSRSSPDLLRKSNKDNTRLKYSVESVDQLEDSESSSSSQSKEESSHENDFFFSRDEQSDKSLRESSPVRPPRKTKKKKAPLPPPLQNYHKNAFTKEILKDCGSILPPKKCNENLFRLTDDGHVTTLRNSLCDVNNEFNYEEQCEKSLEGDKFFHCKLTPSFSLDTSSHSRSVDSSPKNKSNNNNDSLQLHPLPMGSPPKKPPRTFAYDIYRSVKKEKKNPETISSPPTKLTEEEIESLYSKPIKRLKDKSASPRSLDISTEDNGGKAPAKPMIAPKPTELLNKSKKRLSAVEPLTTNHNDLINEKSSIKRNSSFRFSFKKSGKSIGPHLRQISPRRELNMGKKLRNVVRNFSPKRGSETDKRVRFQSDYEDVLNEDSVVYATPITKEVKSKEGPQELHYMCSPLFDDNENSVHHKENRPPSSPRHLRPGLMNGLREELRQSCRFVQKRLKSTPNGRRKYKAVSTPRH